MRPAANSSVLSDVAPTANRKYTSRGHILRFCTTALRGRRAPPSQSDGLGGVLQVPAVYERLQYIKVAPLVSAGRAKATRCVRERTRCNRVRPLFTHRTMSIRPRKASSIAHLPYFYIGASIRNCLRGGYLQRCAITAIVSDVCMAA